MGNKTGKSIFLISLLIVMAITKCFAQNDSAALVEADTVNFSVNSAEGWQLFNSYVASYNTDSVQLEIIIRHTNNIDLNQEQYVGKIKTSSLRPNSERIIPFSLVGTNYRVRIETSGKCYMKVVSGAAPTGNPVVIPFLLIYKK
jgi:hypothetical protein